MNFFTHSKDRSSSIKTNKVYSILVNSQEGKFVFSTENNLKKNNNLIKFIPDISFFIFNIDPTKDHEFYNLIDVNGGIQLGFLNMNGNLETKLNYFGHRFLLNINLHENTDNNLYLNPLHNISENKSIANKIENLSSRNIGFYIQNNDLSLTHSNEEILTFISKLNPLIISDQDECQSKTHICFAVSDEILSDISLIKYTNMLTNIGLENKWFIVIKYDEKFANEIKNMIRITRSGKMNIPESVMRNLIKST